MRTFTIPLKIRSITRTLNHQRNICKIKVILTRRLLDHFFQGASTMDFVNVSHHRNTA
jgi:hypothetical protein